MDPSHSPPSATGSRPTHGLTLRLDQISLHTPTNGRAELDTEAVDRLQRDIATNGILQPIVVRPHGPGYQLIAGRHRLEVARRLRWKTIPATVVDGDDDHAATLRLAENLSRSDLSPVEQACALAPLVERDPLGTDGVARRFGRSREWVENRLEILTWTSELQAHVHERSISMAAARRLARVPDPEERRTLIHAAATHGASARTTALWLQDAVARQRPDVEPPQKTSESTAVQQKVETRVRCLGCEQPTDYAQCASVWICRGCLQTITEAKRAGQLAG